MKNDKKINLLILLVFVFACILLVWANNSPIVGDYYTIHIRDTEIELASAFATALRTNHPAAYDMIDLSLKPRLDAWMNTHQSKKCVHPADLFLVGSDTNGDYDVSFGCYGSNGWIDLEIDNIVIRDMKVIDWGEIREED